MSRSLNQDNNGSLPVRKVRRRIKKIKNHVSRTETMKQESERQFLEHLAMLAECDREMERSNENQ